jgi:hypothetical protein
VLAGAQSTLAHARIDSILPANGSLQGDSYVWQGASSLEPTITATNISAAESQSTFAFAAGVAFAIAAAAFIAFVQEVPKKSTALAAGFEYVDISDVLKGHDVCAKDNWINRAIPSDAHLSYHPNITGHKRSRNGCLHASGPRLAGPT